MPTFDGIDLGAVGSPKVVPSPKRRQRNAYCGVNGEEWLDLGSSGGVIDFETLLIADGPPDLNLVELTWYGYQLSGAARTFVDNYGNVINNVVLDFYEPLEPVVVMGDGGAGRMVRFRFIFPI